MIIGDMDGHGGGSSVTSTFVQTLPLPLIGSFNTMATITVPGPRHNFRHLGTRLECVTHTIINVISIKKEKHIYIYNK